MTEPLSQQGRDLLNRELAFEAVEVLRHAVAAAEPSAPDLLARAYLDSGSWHAAAEWLGQLVERGRVEFAGRLGVALAELGHKDRAEDALRLALQHGELAAANDLALLLRDEGRSGEAIQVLTRAADAGDALAPDNLVAFHLESGDLRAAIAAAERYVDDARPDTVVALADARAAAGRDDEAEELYRRAGALGAVRAHTAYAGFLLDGRGDAAGAEREFREARRHREPGSAYALGQFLLDDGRPEEAREHLVVGANAGDRNAARALAELDGEDPTDD
ncbi:tetratricopeptide repeat protein [Pseudonocardia acidicola]|uniref:Tetratricopeptide repeat protein n=1 Tax=Pseudonocardia acidicola TaxID=2724939 RepID=A0ABX1SHE5_9PSEU|nr:tetratricopeptide repeat protein [Pseudonocardia acidicola]NMH99811.1 tetratricopeptide repeat protein [Pseudonocardia acidicola]